VSKICCFIPSKNRPHTRTHQLFASVNIPVLHVVEPQDAAAYAERGLNIVTLPDNDRGLPFSRNFTLDYATRQGYDVIFMCDDDVEVFGRTVNKKSQRDHSVLTEIVTLVDKNPYAIVGIEYRQHSWSHCKSFAINSGWIDVCIAMQPKYVTARYTDALELKEDRDWQLENIKSGIDLLRVNVFYFGCPDVGTNSGGLQDKYKAKKDSRAAQLMAMKWSPYVELVRKGDRLDCKANWPLIRTRLRRAKE